MSDLHAFARRVQHDLGKYATLQTRWLPADASSEEREEAARADLLSTARGPDGSTDAGTLASAFLDEGEAVGLSREHDLALALERLKGAVERLRAAAPGTAEAAHAVEDGVRAAADLRAAARHLVASTAPDPSAS